MWENCTKFTREETVMEYGIDVLKGLHPGLLIAWDIKQRGITMAALSETTGIMYAHVRAILHGKFKISLGQSLILERELDYDAGLLQTLQLHYEIRSSLKNESGMPDLTQSSKRLF